MSITKTGMIKILSGLNRYQVETGRMIERAAGGYFLVSDVVELLARDSKLTAEQLAVLFHETYERLAPSFGYETRADTKVFDPTSNNGKLMIAVCGELLARLEEQ